MTATNTFTRSFRSVILFCRKCQFSSVTQSCPTLRPHGPQHARPPCPSPTPGVYSNSCPSSRWCHPTTSASVVPFSSWLQCQAFTNSSRSYSPEMYSFGESYFRDLKLCHEAPAYWHWDPSRSFWVVLKISSQPCSCVGWRKKGGWERVNLFWKLALMIFWNLLYGLCARQWASSLRWAMSLNSVTAAGGRLTVTVVYAGGYHGPWKRQNDSRHTPGREGAQTKEVTF